ncbi:armadillo-like helical domain-containing protein 4 [Erinaceus europaeus]|uniref:Armadillo-like helical domain-containing protein 4 n=1 Tax=Erinaceus europaeus TaxID=9365 RepID=A0A1S2ZH32_ERIEU|nr:armadillo-like helical domain-containing protein 4 [Erinaceus europaeus]
MNRPVVLHICLAFGSFLLLNFATQCLAFPRIESREIVQGKAEGQSERINTDDLENNSVTSRYSAQLEVSDDPMIVLERPSAASPFDKESHLVGTELTQPKNLDVYTATEPVVPAGEGVFGSSQPERVSAENWLSKTVLTSHLITTTSSLNIDENEEPFSSTNVQPVAEGTTEITQDFLKHEDSQLFASESHNGVSLGHSPSPYVNTKEMVTTNPRTEKSESDTEHRTISFPGAEPTADTEPASLTLDPEEPSQMTADNTKFSAAKFTPEYTLSIESETDSLPGAPEVTVSVSTAVPAASVVSDEWDDTKAKHASQIKTPKLRDDTETQVGMEIPQTTQVTDNGMEGGKPLTEVADMALGLPEGETHTGTALLTVHEEDGSPAFTDQSSFTPTSLLEDTKVSVVSLLQNTADIMESTTESNTGFFLETTLSTSGYESEACQPLENSFKDIITHEMTTAVQEAEATLSSVTEEQQVSTLEVAGENGEMEEEIESLSATADITGVTQLSRQWEPLATTASSTAIPPSFQVTPVEDLMDTITRPNEDFFTPVLGSPVTPPGIMEEEHSIFPALSDSESSSERRTIAPTVSYVNTAASYGLNQFDEDGEEDEDEEDEEEEDEDEEDEEDDEEEKDTDSLDDSLDGDTELPGFTIPGITSQEPDLQQGNMDPLEVATYQVPDAIEWERQNQGLVRNWMEKLKDKAGYLSGMLVPVGVGIAGALFILGALYSIKIMNRRRRNGFKRHKRKQREFNSMQDRVMLLADSSEDEF